MTRQYISLFPKPLLDELVEGRWLPLIGAGMSLNAVVPVDKKMPLWDDVGRSLAAEMEDYEYVTALDAISAYCQQFSRTKLVERLADLLLVDRAEPGETHRSFCSIKFPIVCTTNFDFLLERQYDLNPRYCRPVMYEDQLGIPNREPSVQLLKLHGDIHHPNRLICTEEDYDGFLQRYPLIATYLANLLITKTAILIGYSLDDPDLRQIFQLIIDRLGKSRRPIYAIRVGSSSQEIARFERRGVTVINVPGQKSKQGQVFTSVFEELRAYQESAVITASQVTDEAALRELRLPSGAPTRLCYFAVPFALSSLYKELVFPIADENGFVPVTADTVVSPGDSVASKIDALIGKANVAVVDATSNWTQVELQIALSKLGPDRILIIVDRGDALPSDMAGVQILVRPGPPFTDAEQFLQSIASWFEARGQAALQSLEDEPERLLEIGSTRAAVIAALTLLEVELRKKLELTGVPVRPMSTTQLIRLASTNEVISGEAIKQIQSWLKIRNTAVHTPTSISIDEARMVLHGVRELIRTINE